MKVLVCTQMFPESTSEAVVSGMIKNPYNQTIALSKCGCDVDVITTGKVAKNYNVLGVKVRSVGEGYFKGVIKSFTYEIMMFFVFLKLSGWKRYDVVHVHHLNMPFLVVMKLMGLFRGKLIFTAHGTSTPELNAAKQGGTIFYWALKFNGILQHALDKFSWKNADLVLSPSEYQVKEMVDMYSVPPSSIKVVYNGFDSDLYKPDLRLRESGRNEMRISKGDLVVLFVGRAASKKGIDHLLRAMDVVCQEVSGLRLVLVLGFLGRQKDYLEKITKLAREREYVDLYLNVAEEDMPTYYNSADLCVFPSLGYESIPTVIFESMACELPILTQGSWGIPEVLDSYFIDEDSIVSGGLTNKILSLLENRNDLREVAENNYKRSLGYRWSDGGRVLKEIYEAIIDKEVKGA